MLDVDSSILGGMSVGLLQGQLLHVGQGCLVVDLHLHHDGQVHVVLPVLAGQGQGVPANIRLYCTNTFSNLVKSHFI